jgi:putative lipase involved disintegration of autophagic bodies
VKLLVEDAAAYAVRTTLNVTTTESSANSGYPGGATPNKRRVATIVPILLADGSYFNNQVINEMIVHPETTDAQITALRSLGVNIYNDADFDGLWKQGSKS